MKETLADIKKETWSLLKETQKLVKANSEQMKKTDEQMKKTDEVLSKRFKETDEKMKKTDEQMKKTDEVLSKRFKETDEKINKICGDYDNRFGKLGENLTKGGLVQELNRRDIKVDRFITNIRSKDIECDILALNGKEIVVVEVKNTLRRSDVKKFSQILKNHFKEAFPEHKDKTVYGAVAYLLELKHGANELANEEGFFVIEATGSIIIKNVQSFKPKVF